MSFDDFGEDLDNLHNATESKRHYTRSRDSTVPTLTSRFLHERQLATRSHHILSISNALDSVLDNLPGKNIVKDEFIDAKLILSVGVAHSFRAPSYTLWWRSCRAASDYTTVIDAVVPLFEGYHCEQVNLVIAQGRSINACNIKICELNHQLRDQNTTQDRQWLQLQLEKTEYLRRTTQYRIEHETNITGLRCNIVQSLLRVRDLLQEAIMIEKKFTDGYEMVSEQELIDKIRGIEVEKSQTTKTTTTITTPSSSPRIAAVLDLKALNNELIDIEMQIKGIGKAINGMQIAELQETLQWHLKVQGH